MHLALTPGLTRGLTQESCEDDLRLQEPLIGRDRTKGYVEIYVTLGQ
jgi:hypothetical protein